MIDDKSKFCKRERERESERKKERERERISTGNKVVLEKNIDSTTKVPGIGIGIKH